MSALFPRWYTLAQRFGHYARWGVLIMLMLISSVLAVKFKNSYRWRAGLLRDYSNDPFLRLVGSRQGLLLVCSDTPHLHMLTRRPVLFEGISLDVIMYVPDVAPEINRILKDVYGMDLFHPPPGRHYGALVRNDGKELWESRSPRQWAEIRKKYAVTDIITYPDWTLKLPIVARNDQYILYEIRSVDSGNGGR